jgi:hypothetical protein
VSIDPVLDIVNRVSAIDRQDVAVQNVLLNTILVPKVRSDRMNFDYGVAIAYDMAHEESMLEPERAETVGVI